MESARTGEILPVSEIKRAIEPSAGGGFEAGGAGFHVVLRVEVGTRRVGRAGGVDDGEMALIVERLERGKSGVQAEVAVKIDSGVVAGAGTRDGDGRAEIVVGLFGVRDDDVEAIGGTALEDGYEHFFAASGSILRIEGAFEPNRSSTDADHGEGGIAKEDAA